MKFREAKKSFTLVELPVVRKRVIDPERSRRAFTLVELLIVMAIISIIAAFIVVNLASSRARARDTKRVSDLEALDSAINRYYREVGHYPDLPKDCGTDKVDGGVDGGINGISSDQVTSLTGGKCISAGGYIKGLVPAYISKLPVDSGPQLLNGDGKETRGFVYIHSNQNIQNIECYKIMALNPESPKLAGYKSLWDPKHDGGNNSSIVDDTNISAWSKYSRGCAAK